jgi:hypothetical protein
VKYNYSLNILQNVKNHRCIVIFFQLLDAENITMGKFGTCLVRKVTYAVDSVNETLKHAKQLQSFLPEAVPEGVDKIPTLADIGRCGFTTAMTGKRLINCVK